MAVSSCPRVFPSFECRSDPDSSSHAKPELPGGGRRFSCRLNRPDGSATCFAGGISSLVLRFPPNFVRQLRNKARRNCSNIGVAQVVAASWSDNAAAESAAQIGVAAPSMAEAFGGAAAVSSSTEPIVDLAGGDDVVEKVAGSKSNGAVNSSSSSSSSAISSFTGKSDLRPPFLNSDGSIAIHAGERLGRGIATDAITTPVVNTTAYFFKKTSDLIDFKEGRHVSYEYGRYGNYTTEAAEAKISALEGAESTLFMASGMCVSTVMLLALVPAGGHIVTTTDCYRKTRIFIENFLPRMGIQVTVIDPADVEGLKTALDTYNVNLFFTESPTNPFLRCVDIKLVSDLCHSKGALVCIDGTFATPLNQKALALGADMILHSATKYIGGHNDVIAGCISGSKEVLAPVRTMHHILGGTLNPNAAYLIIRGMKTLHLRIKQQNETATKMAKLLEAHPKVARVYYLGLTSHPEHELAKQQMTGFGGVVSFEVDGDIETTIRFIDSLKIPYIAPSFGGVESIVDQPAIMSYWDLPGPERLRYGIKDTLVRFSFGIEDFEDLKADILQALDMA